MVYTAAASAAFAVEARNLQVARLGLTRRAVEPHTARRGISGATVPSAQQALDRPGHAPR